MVNKIQKDLNIMNFFGSVKVRKFATILCYCIGNKSSNKPSTGLPQNIRITMRQENKKNT